MSWSDAWIQIAGLSSDYPQWIVAVIVLFYIYGLVIFPSALFVSYVERKISADLQARVGPSLTGWFGILQPVADILKLIQKGIGQKYRWSEEFWLHVVFMVLYSTVAILPLGSLILLVNTEMSVFVPFWAVLVLALSTVLLGFNQGTVPGRFGGIRVAAQAVSGLFPALIAVLCVGIHAGGFSWEVVANAQKASPSTWTLFANPFQFLAFIVFVISGLVAMSVPPLDSGLSESDIHGGVGSQLYGRRYSLFRFGRFYGLFLWSVIANVLFCGAWKIPDALREYYLSEKAYFSLQLTELLVILAKTFILIFIVSWISSVNPRLRVDQVTDATWRVLSPLALFCMIGAAIWTGGLVW